MGFWGLLLDFEAVGSKLSDYDINPVSRFHKPTLEPHEIRGPFEIAGIPVIPFMQDHGFSTTVALRIGGFAYSTDVSELDDAAFAAVEGVELWIVDCLRREPHPTHSHLAKTLSWIARVRPRRALHGSKAPRR